MSTKIDEWRRGEDETIWERKEGWWDVRCRKCGEMASEMEQKADKHQGMQCRCGKWLALPPADRSIPPQDVGGWEGGRPLFGG